MTQDSSDETVYFPHDDFTLALSPDLGQRQFPDPVNSVQYREGQLGNLILPRLKKPSRDAQEAIALPAGKPEQSGKPGKEVVFSELGNDFSLPCVQPTGL